MEKTFLHEHYAIKFDLLKKMLLFFNNFDVCCRCFGVLKSIFGVFSAYFDCFYCNLGEQTNPRKTNLGKNQSNKNLKKVKIFPTFGKV